MTWKEFRSWMHQRTCDGMWGFMQAAYLIQIYKTVYKKPFWRRNRYFSKVWEQERLLRDTIDVINAEIERINQMNLEDLSSKENSIFEGGSNDG